MTDPIPENIPIPDHIWSWAESVRIHGGLPDGRLIHLCGIHLSLHELYASGLQEGASARRSVLLRRIRRLFDECVSRCGDCGDAVRLARFVPLLYRLSRPCLVPVKSGLPGICDTVAGHLVDLWTNGKTSSWREEHGAMKALIELSDIPEETARENDAAFRKYRSVLSAWSRTLSAGGGWQGVSEAEALGRLEVMSLHSGMLPDDTFDDSLSRSYLYYRRKIIRKGIPTENLLPLLELESGIACRQRMGTDMIRGIRADALKEMGGCAPDRDEYWLLLSVLTECIRMEQLHACYNSICI